MSSKMINFIRREVSHSAGNKEDLLIDTEGYAHIAPTSPENIEILKAIEERITSADEETFNR